MIEVNEMKKLAVGIVLITCVVASAFLHVYYVNEGATGDLLWKGEEAYLIVSVGSLGYRLSCLQAPMEFLSRLLKKSEIL